MTDINEKTRQKLCEEANELGQKLAVLINNNDKGVIITALGAVLADVICGIGSLDTDLYFNKIKECIAVRKAEKDDLHP